MSGKPSRVWLDITGIVPGSDGAVFAMALAPALGRIVDTRLCIRRPGLDEIGDAEARSLLKPVQRDRRTDRVAAAVRARVSSLRPDLRRALSRAARLQLHALDSWQAVLTRSTAKPTIPVLDTMRDTARIGAGDVLLMLAPAGDATRFHACGARLALLLAELLPLCRADQVSERQSQEAALWVRTTLQALDATMVCTAEAASVLQDAGAADLPRIIAAAPTVTAMLDPGRAGGTVLALGEIGLGGNTLMLLQAWRELLDEAQPGAGRTDRLPTLVIAGPVGHLSSTILAQLRNSAGYGGTVRLVPDPSAAVLADLLVDARFCICPAAHEAWPRGVIECQGAGKAVLAVAASTDGEGIETGNARDLTARLRGWIAEPPALVAPVRRAWDDVAGEIMSVLTR